MRKVKIPKRNGKFRTVYIPSRGQRKAMRRLLGALEGIAARECPPNVVHGFMHGRSPVTNAAQHAGYAITVSFDLSSFFDTVTPHHLDYCRERIDGQLYVRVIAECFPDGAARQGLPTSPAIGNIAAALMDWQIGREFWPRGVQYTRYADDMVFSFNDATLIPVLLARIPQIAAEHGFTVNADKTSVQYARAGRRNITGVMCDVHSVHASRKHRRRLRAAIHQGNADQAAGLGEWCAVKFPKRYVQDEQDAVKRFHAEVGAAVQRAGGQCDVLEA